MIEHVSQTEITQIREDIREIRDILKPIAETYTTASYVGKWLMGLAVFVSVAIGIFMEILKLTKK